MMLIFAGIVMALTFFAIMARVHMRRCLGYATQLDLLFTAALFWLLKDTFSGAVSGAVAGLTLAIGLSVLRKLIGYDKLRVQRVKYKVKLVWVHTPPTWTLNRLMEKTNAKLTPHVHA